MDRIELDVGPVAHGGHCVARHEGQVVFVRHALPGERVVAEVTGSGGGGRFLRADAVEVLSAAPGRRPAPCPVAARCGGCDWQHATPATARQLKTAVVREALARFAGIDLPDDFAVREVAWPAELAAAFRARGVAVPDGLGWRTRGTLAVDQAGRAGFRAPRSHEVVVAGACLQLDPRLGALDLFAQSWPPERGVRFVAPGRGEPLARATAVAGAEEQGGRPLRGGSGRGSRRGSGRASRGDAAAAVAREAAVVTETAEGRDFQVAWDGFWQVHPGAADALVGEVRRLLDPRPGERLLDLYSGVGLFGISLAAGCPGLRVRLVEGDARACALAAQNATGLDVRIVRSDVRRWASRSDTGRPDVVVLDPPRTGAGADVVRAVATAGARAIAYVACDPVALARDVETFARQGYALEELVGLDLFPTTHHVECVALLAPVGQR